MLVKINVIPNLTKPDPFLSDMEEGQWFIWKEDRDSTSPVVMLVLNKTKINIRFNVIGCVGDPIDRVISDANDLSVLRVKLTEVSIKIEG